MTLWFFISGLLCVALLFVCYPLLKSQKKSRLIICSLIFAVFFLSIASIVVYLKKSGYDAWRHYQSAQDETRYAFSVLKTIKSPQMVIDQLHAYLKNDPNHAKGWYLLGRLYLGEMHYRAALDAFSQAMKGDHKKSAYHIAYVQADFLCRHGRLTPQEIIFLKSILSRRDNYVEAMNLLAMNAYHQKQFAMAIQDWEKLRPLFSHNSASAHAVLKMIAMAQQQVRQKIRSMHELTPASGAPT